MARDKNWERVTIKGEIQLPGAFVKPAEGKPALGAFHIYNRTLFVGLRGGQWGEVPLYGHGGSNAEIKRRVHTLETRALRANLEMAKVEKRLLSIERSGQMFLFDYHGGDGPMTATERAPKPSFISDAQLTMFKKNVKKLYSNNMKTKAHKKQTNFHKGEKNFLKKLPEAIIKLTNRLEMMLKLQSTKNRIQYTGMVSRATTASNARISVFEATVSTLASTVNAIDVRLGAVESTVDAIDVRLGVVESLTASNTARIAALEISVGTSAITPFAASNFTAELHHHIRRVFDTLSAYLTETESIDGGATASIETAKALLAVEEARTANMSSTSTSSAGIAIADIDIVSALHAVAMLEVLDALGATTALAGVTVDNSGLATDLEVFQERYAVASEAYISVDTNLLAFFADHAQNMTQIAQHLVEYHASSMSARGSGRSARSTTYDWTNFGDANMAGICLASPQSINAYGTANPLIETRTYDPSTVISSAEYLNAEYYTSALRVNIARAWFGLYDFAKCLGDQTLSQTNSDELTSINELIMFEKERIKDVIAEVETTGSLHSSESEYARTDLMNMKWVPLALRDIADELDAAGAGRSGVFSGVWTAESGEIAGFAADAAESSSDIYEGTVTNSRVSLLFDGDDGFAAHAAKVAEITNRLHLLIANAVAPATYTPDAPARDIACELTRARASVGEIVDPNELWLWAYSSYAGEGSAAMTAASSTTPFAATDLSANNRANCIAVFDNLLLLTMILESEHRASATGEVYTAFSTLRTKLAVEYVRLQPFSGATDDTNDNTPVESLSYDAHMHVVHTSAMLADIYDAAGVEHDEVAGHVMRLRDAAAFGAVAAGHESNPLLAWTDEDDVLIATSDAGATLVQGDFREHATNMYEMLQLLDDVVLPGVLGSVYTRGEAVGTRGGARSLDAESVTLAAEYASVASYSGNVCALAVTAAEAAGHTTSSAPLTATEFPEELATHVVRNVNATYLALHALRALQASDAQLGIGADATDVETALASCESALYPEIARVHTALSRNQSPSFSTDAAEAFTHNTIEHTLKIAQLQRAIEQALVLDLHVPGVREHAASFTLLLDAQRFVAIVNADNDYGGAVCGTAEVQQLTNFAAHATAVVEILQTLDKLLAEAIGSTYTHREALDDESGRVASFRGALFAPATDAFASTTPTSGAAFDPVDFDASMVAHVVHVWNNVAMYSHRLESVVARRGIGASTDMSALLGEFAGGTLDDVLAAVRTALESEKGRIEPLLSDSAVLAGDAYVSDALSAMSLSHHVHMCDALLQYAIDVYAARGDLGCAFQQRAYSGAIKQIDAAYYGERYADAASSRVGDEASGLDTVEEVFGTHAITMNNALYALRACIVAITGVSSLGAVGDALVSDNATYAASNQLQPVFVMWPKAFDDYSDALASSANVFVAAQFDGMLASLVVGTLNACAAIHHHFAELATANGANSTITDMLSTIETTLREERERADALNNATFTSDDNVVGALSTNNLAHYADESRYVFALASAISADDVASTALAGSLLYKYAPVFDQLATSNSSTTTVFGAITGFKAHAAAITYISETFEGELKPALLGSVAINLALYDERTRVRVLCDAAGPIAGDDPTASDASFETFDAYKSDFDPTVARTMLHVTAVLSAIVVRLEGIDTGAATSALGDARGICARETFRLATLYGGYTETETAASSYNASTAVYTSSAVSSFGLKHIAHMTELIVGDYDDSAKSSILRTLADAGVPMSAGALGGGLWPDATLFYEMASATGQDMSADNYDAASAGKDLMDNVAFQQHALETEKLVLKIFSAIEAMYAGSMSVTIPPELYKVAGEISAYSVDADVVDVWGVTLPDPDTGLVAFNGDEFPSDVARDMLRMHSMLVTAWTLMGGVSAASGSRLETVAQLLANEKERLVPLRAQFSGVNAASTSSIATVDAAIVTSGDTLAADAIAHIYDMTTATRAIALVLVATGVVDDIAWAQGMLLDRVHFDATTLADNASTTSFDGTAWASGASNNYEFCAASNGAGPASNASAFHCQNVLAAVEALALTARDQMYSEIGTEAIGSVADDRISEALAICKYEVINVSNQTACFVSTTGLAASVGNFDRFVAAASASNLVGSVFAVDELSPVLATHMIRVLSELAGICELISDVDAANPSSGLATTIAEIEELIGLEVMRLDNYVAIIDPNSTSGNLTLDDNSGATTLDADSLGQMTHMTVVLKVLALHAIDWAIYNGVSLPTPIATAIASGGARDRVGDGMVNVTDSTLFTAFDTQTATTVSSGTSDFNGTNSMFATHSEHTFNINRIVFLLQAATELDQNTAFTNYRSTDASNAAVLHSMMSQWAMATNCTIAYATEVGDSHWLYEQAGVNDGTIAQVTTNYNLPLRNFCIGVFNFNMYMLFHFLSNEPTSSTANDIWQDTTMRNSVLLKLGRVAWRIRPWCLDGVADDTNFDASALEAHSQKFVYDMFGMVEYFGRVISSGTGIQEAVSGSALPDWFAANGLISQVGLEIQTSFDPGSATAVQTQQMNYSSTDVELLAGDFGDIAADLIDLMNEVYVVANLCTTVSSSLTYTSRFTGKSSWSEQDMLEEFALLSTHLGSALPSALFAGSGFSALNMSGAAVDTDTLGAAMATAGTLTLPLSACTAGDRGLRDAFSRVFNAVWFVDWSIYASNASSNYPDRDSTTSGSISANLATIAAFLEVWDPLESDDDFVKTLDYESLGWVVQWSYSASEFLNMFMYESMSPTLQDSPTFSVAAPISQSCVEQTFRDMKRYEQVLADVYDGGSWGTAYLFDDDALYTHFTMLLETMQSMLTLVKGEWASASVATFYADWQPTGGTWGYDESFASYAERTLEDSVYVDSTLYMNGKALNNLIQRAVVIHNTANNGTIFVDCNSVSINCRLFFEAGITITDSTGAAQELGNNRWGFVESTGALSLSGYDESFTVTYDETSSMTYERTAAFNGLMSQAYTDTSNNVGLGQSGTATVVYLKQDDGDDGALTLMPNLASSSVNHDTVMALTTVITFHAI